MKGFIKLHVIRKSLTLRTFPYMPVNLSHYGAVFFGDMKYGCLQSLGLYHAESAIIILDIFQCKISYYYSFSGKDSYHALAFKLQEGIPKRSYTYSELGANLAQTDWIPRPHGHLRYLFPEIITDLFPKR